MFVLDFRRKIRLERFDGRQQGAEQGGDVSTTGSGNRRRRRSTHRRCRRAVIADGM